MAEFNWPAAGTVTIGAIGANGATAPTLSLEVGGVGPDGNLHPIATDNAGVQSTNVLTSALPTGASTAANQTLEITQLTAINTNTTGVSTAANQVTGNSSVASIDTKTPALVTGRVPVDGSGVTQPVSGTVAVSNFPATQPVSGSVSVSNFPATQAISAAALPLPTGASTSSAQTTGNASLASIDGKVPALGQALAASSVPVVLTALQLTALTPLTTVGATSVGTAISNAPIRNIYSSTPITTIAYVQLVASTSNATNSIHIFDSSGQAMVLALGGAGSEVDMLYVQPGGDTYALNIPASTRVSYKALSGNATIGYLTMSFLR